MDEGDVVIFILGVGYNVKYYLHMYYLPKPIGVD